MGAQKYTKLREDTDGKIFWDEEQPRREAISLAASNSLAADIEFWLPVYKDEEDAPPAWLSEYETSDKGKDARLGLGELIVDRRLSSDSQSLSDANMKKLESLELRSSVRSGSVRGSARGSVSSQSSASTPSRDSISINSLRSRARGSANSRQSNLRRTAPAVRRRSQSFDSGLRRSTNARQSTNNTGLNDFLGGSLGALFLDGMVSDAQSVSGSVAERRENRRRAKKQKEEDAGTARSRRGNIQLGSSQRRARKATSGGPKADYNWTTKEASSKGNKAAKHMSSSSSKEHNNKSSKPMSSKCSSMNDFYDWKKESNSSRQRDGRRRRSVACTTPMRADRANRLVKSCNGKLDCKAREQLIQEMGDTSERSKRGTRTKGKSQKDKRKKDRRKRRESNCSTSSTSSAKTASALVTASASFSSAASSAEKAAALASALEQQASTARRRSSGTDPQTLQRIDEIVSKAEAAASAAQELLTLFHAELDGTESTLDSSSSEDDDLPGLQRCSTAPCSHVTY